MNTARSAVLKKTLLCSLTRRFFQIGFNLHAPSAILPGYDTSVLFTGSTISTFKPYIERGAIGNSFYAVQACIRTRNADTLADLSKPLLWSSCFVSFGTFSDYGRLQTLCDCVFDALHDPLLPSGEIIAKAATHDQDICRCLAASGFRGKTRFDTEPRHYYTHRFGMPDVQGRNVNLAVYNHAANAFQDIGNIIIIEVNGIPRYAEVSFGLETMAARMLGLANPIYATDLALIAAWDHPLADRVYDALNACIVIASAGIAPVATNRGRVLRRYLQCLHALVREAGLPLDVLKSWLILLTEKNAQLSRESAADIITYLLKYDNLLSAGIPPAKINQTAAASFSRHC